VLAAAAAAVLLAPAAGLAVVSHSHGGDSDEFDSRTATLAPTIAQLEAVEQLGAEASWTRFGTPQSLVRHGGSLGSGIAAADAEAAVRSWLDANTTLFRGIAGDLELDRVLALGAGKAVLLRQRIGGELASPDGQLVAAVTGNRTDGWTVVYVSSSLVSSETVTNSVELSAAEAFAEAAHAVDADVAPSDVRATGTAQGWTELTVEGLEDTQLVRRVAFATPARGVRSAYETIYSEPESEGFRQIVDAESGAVLLRQSITDHVADNPRWKVFPNTPPLTTLNQHPWNYSSSDTRDIWCWTPAPGCELAVKNSASRVPWDVDARTNTPTFTTDGNNNFAHEAWNSGAGTFYKPVSPSREYIYPWNNVWFESKCDPTVLTPGGNDIDAAIVNLFTMHNRMHDWSYYLGFTELRWNGQDYNFGSPTLENDGLEGRAQAGAITPKSRDNANMNTRPDGTPSLTNMFLWQPIAGAFYAPCVDGDYDMSVIAHEFGHMIENRMIGKGVRRQGDHAGAMGESIADLFAMEYLSEYGFAPVDGESPTAVGPYVTGNPFRGIRNYNMAFASAGEFPTEGRYPFINPLNFSAVAYDIVGEQVHADGEIWSATNFDIRRLFNERYGSGSESLQRECADGERPPEQCPGNRRWMQLYYDAMVLMPVAPSFLDARDAMLVADVMRFGRANQDLLWLGFARRGFGEDATTTGNGDEEPRGGWQSPNHGEATLTFRALARDEDEVPIPAAQFYVGQYEARVTPIANTTRFVPDPDGYEFVAKAPGYGHVRFHVDRLRAGETRTVTVYMPTNWASSAKGATAAGDGENHARLIDDTEGTNWRALGAPAPGRQVVITLAGPRQIKLSRASALLVPGDNRYTALRQFELYTCLAGASSANPTCDGANAAGWTRILRTDGDAFPGVNPRPTAPDLHLRTFDTANEWATHVKLMVVHNQCTGTPSFQGEQDADPANPTDCRDTTVDEQVRASELQLFSSWAHVTGAKAEDQAPTSDG
jgi:extracellular elastinolytic metalloproteinase